MNTRDSPKSTHTFRTACTPIHYIHSQHLIDTATMEFLLPPRNTHTPLFYGLPKMHKPNFTLHPIRSGCDGLADRLSLYLTQFSHTLANNLPSNINDTPFQPH